MHLSCNLVPRVSHLVIDHDFRHNIVKVAVDS